MTHAQIRGVKKWGTFGRYGNEPLKWIFIKDLSDSHLLHIIQHIKDNIRHFGYYTLKIMEDEQKFLTDNYIFISDYK
jgi:hypothetical protein